MPVRVGERTIHVSAYQLDPDRHDDEIEIAARAPTLDKAVDDLISVAREIGRKLQDTRASRVSVEFGCSFAVKSGALVALVGEASAKSAIKIDLEWTAPTQ